MRVFVLALLATFFFATPSFAAERKLDDFFGAYLGHGEEVPLAETDKQKRPRFSQVIIRPAKEQKGFTIEWSTMKLKGDEVPSEVDTKTYVLTFRPTDEPNVYRDVQTDPKEHEVSWAVLNKDTLSILQVSVAPDGGYLLARYDRRLTPKGMEVRFTRLENGKVIRNVKLSLLKGPAKVN